MSQYPPVIEDLVRKIVEAEKCFRRACNQILVLNRALRALQFRYDLVMKQDARAFRYTLRVRIAVLEGVRNMYYTYATMKADLIVELRKQIQVEHENAISALDCDEDESEVYYDDEYDLSDSELEYSDFDFSDIDDDEGDTELNASFLIVNNAHDASFVEADSQGIQLSVGKSEKETDLNGTEISIDSGYLDGSHLEDDI